MEKLYHVNDNGDVSECHAQSGGCPFGDDSHADTKAGAQQIFQERRGTGLPQRYSIPSDEKRAQRKRILKRSAAAVVIGSVAVLGTSLAACSSQSQIHPSYVKVCQSQTTHMRVADKSCDTKNSATHNAVAWYYLHIAGGHVTDGGYIPAVGQQVAHGSTHAPAGDVGVVNYSSHGGSYSKSGIVGNGFGAGHAGDHAGGHAGHAGGEGGHVGG